ncbi:MAG: SusC/RagA family TonB-linked outer membrane protein [Flavobacteriaceae bacterium]|nr:SusC/RagA family TonB-linked outer membrane protein [Flavobacteriaceae bacterium]
MKKINFLLITVFSVLITISSYAQEKTITGTVTSKSDGTALPGVNIIVQGTTRGAQTDFEGNYSITASVGEVLNFSFIGMKAVSITVGDSNVINVVLEEDAASLDEVVVTALGISREKKSLGYAVTELQSEEINTVKNHNVANSLVGKVAGLVVNQSGGVGSGSRITIRGNNSITGSSQALIVVDGVPIDASGSESGGSVYNSTVTGGGITDINPEDIESVSVLKGPNAAALYGSRAARGVLLITTKKGAKNKGLGISINSNITFENPMFLPDYQNQYGQGSNGTAPATLNDLTGSSWGAALDGSQQLYYTGEQRSYSAQPNNVEDFFETGVQSINSIALDQGGENYSTRFSYTNNTSSSMLPNSELKSHNFNLRSIFDLSDKLSIDTKATYFTQELNNRVNIGTEGVLAYVYTMPRNIAISDLERFQVENPSAYDIPTGQNEYQVISYGIPGGTTGNPYWMLRHDINDQKRNRFLGVARVNYEINDWLSAFIRIGADVTDVRSESVEWPGHHFQLWGRLNVDSNKYVEMNTDFLLTATKDISDKLNVIASVGGNLLKQTFEGISVSGSQFKIPTRAFIGNTNIQTNGQTPFGMRKVNSLYGSVNLAYDNFMYLDITGRNDWFSTLKNRSYFYPSVSYSVLIDRFIDPEKDVFNMLKLRASWADVGNDTDSYLINQTFPLPGQGYLGLTVLTTPELRYNEDLKPESIRSSEFGVEMKLFKNRLYSELSIYKITTKDMIFQIPAPTGAVFEKFLENIGELENKGVEVLIGGIPAKTENFSWDVSLNFSRNKNKLKDLIEGITITTLNSTNSGNVSIVAEVGGSVGDIYGTVWDRDESGNLLVNAEGLPIASSDKVYLGNAQPDWIAGLSNTLTYKNFALRFLIDARFGGEIYSGTSASLDNSGASERSLQYRNGGVVLDAINTSTNAQNTVNITAQDYWGRYSTIAENYVYDQTNIRLREFALSYNLPSSAAEKIGMRSASIGLIGRNLFFFSKKAEDIDPEVALGTSLSSQGIAVNNVPTVKSLGLNISLKF